MIYQLLTSYAQQFTRYLLENVAGQTNRTNGHIKTDIMQKRYINTFYSLGIQKQVSFSTEALLFFYLWAHKARYYAKKAMPNHMQCKRDALLFFYLWLHKPKYHAKNMPNQISCKTNAC